MREVAIKLLRIYHRDRWCISPRKLGASVDDVVLDARKPPPPEDAAIIAEQCSPIAARFGYPRGGPHGPHVADRDAERRVATLMNFTGPA